MSRTSQPPGPQASKASSAGRFSSADSEHPNRFNPIAIRKRPRNRPWKAEKCGVEWLPVSTFSSQWGSGMQTRLPYWFSGILFLLCGGAFVVSTLWANHWLLWALGVASGLFGIVRIVQDRMVRGRVEFTPEELEKWGERLSAGTPRILKMLEERDPESGGRCDGTGPGNPPGNLPPVHHCPGTTQQSLGLTPESTPNARSPFLHDGALWIQNPDSPYLLEEANKTPRLLGARRGGWVPRPFAQP